MTITDAATIAVRILGTDLPGRTFLEAGGAVADRHNVHLGVQRARVVVDLVPGDAELASFAFEVAVKAGRFSGPFVHGRAPEQFFYLSWGDLSGDAQFTMFRRAKLRLDEFDPNALAGRVLEGRLGLGGAHGPICGSVRPPAITWTIVN